jgi:poly-beta-hydroxybutyrate-responsive repressor
VAARGTFLQTCLLLLVGEQSDHGYGLVRRLAAFGFCDSDPGRIYRALRQLEEDAELTSDWRTAPSGPARRIYRLTPAGAESLSRRINVLRELRADIDVVLAHHDRGLPAADVVQLPGQRVASEGLVLNE